MNKLSKILLLLISSIFFLFWTFGSIKVSVKSDPKYSLSEELRNTISVCQNEVKFEHELLVATFLTDDSNYAYSAIKLLKSIVKNAETTMFDKLILELTQKPLEVNLKKKLLDAGWKFCQVNRIAPRDEAQTFPRFLDQFTKLILWNMTEYKRIVYLDSDVLVVGKIDNLLNVHNYLDRDNLKIACTRDIRGGVWQNAFNMGVFAIKPNGTEFKRLIQMKNDSNVKFESLMSEQGFLNVVYKDKWHEFGFQNNANLAAYSQDRDYWDSFGNTLNVIHYTINKPWACGQAYRKVCDQWRNFKHID